MKTKNKYGIVLLLIIVGFLSLALFKDNTLASSELFKDVNFNSENTEVVVVTIDTERRPIFEEFIPSESEKETFINALKNSRYEKIPKSPYMDYHYRVKIRIDGDLQDVYADKDLKMIEFIFEHDKGIYKLADDSELFEILNEITKNNTGRPF